MEYEPAFGKDLVCKSDEPLDVASPKREVFVKKLSELQEDNAIKNYRYSLGHNLINLAQGRFKLSKDQILKLDEADLEELALLIYEECLSSVRKFEIAKKVFETTKFTSNGHTFDLDGEWEKIDYVTRVKKVTGINVLTASEKEMKKKLNELGVKYEGDNKERLTDSLWKYCRKQISGPAFLINHPTLIAPLSKAILENTPKGMIVAEVTERFQPLIAGSEVGNGYSELNDPIDQQQRFKAQQKLIDSGDTDAMMLDDEFVEMLEYGMPPTCGFGFGERLFSILADKPLRETQLFPLMKPKNTE